MAATSNANPVFGKIGYKHCERLTILSGAKLITSGFVPADSELHDISQEGIIIRNVRLSFEPTPTAGDNFTFGFFNRTTSVDPSLTPEDAAWCTRFKFSHYTGVGYQLIEEMGYDLSSYPGGGIGLIGDFITLSFASSANVGMNMPLLVQFNYDWVKIDPESYRRLLYARSL